MRMNMSSLDRHPRRSLPAAIAGLLCSMILSGAAHAITVDELAKKVEALEAQNAALQAKVEKLEAAQVQRQGQAVAQARKTVENAAPANSASSDSATTIGSYGEIGYSRPLQATDATNASVGRAVITLGHRFNDSTKFVSEFEWENAITSSDDSGEAEVEQLYVEHEFKNGLRGVAGLYLMPVGLINQSHEPTAYYGVFRPDVDTKIIPSTWREVGLGLSGSTEIGLTWDFGITTDQNLSKWDPADDEGRVRGPLQAIHGEGQFASAANVAVHGALNWRAPGMLVGASI